jgi:hypothetical protein
MDGRTRLKTVSRWTSKLLVVGVILLPVGWILVFVSGYGGNSTGGSEIVWRIGGLTVYASVLMLLIAAVIHVARLAVVAARHLRAARS